MSSKSWIVDFDQDGVITFPEEVILELSWRYDDILEWVDIQKGTWTVKKLTPPRNKRRIQL